MNEIVNKFLLAGDKFMPEMHLKQPGFTYSACGPFTKNKERIQEFMEEGNTNYIYKNDLDRACFQHDMAYGKYKDLSKRKESNKVLRDKDFKIASNPEYDRYQRGLTSMIFRFFDKKSDSGGALNLYQISYNLQMNLINQLLENTNEEKFILHLKIIFGL